ncbi:lipase family protein [Enterobacter roggenkampii]|uniref:lipase family protein n=1 Tax=Enterobacter asburiae TaxID=61645 RepID=UPI0020037D72|nr:lipase family protein [Enterobacter asburiae]EKS6937665.1 lipase family protein [Enterobacter roggenkampii]MCK7140696.1 lipase family protein [Enterobacter asburiae]
MSEYALNDIYNLVQILDDPKTEETKKNNTLRYICSMFAELAYYHIPKWEIDANKRVKLIPCQGYRSWIKDGGETIDLSAVTQSLDLPGFEVSTRSVVAVGRVVQDKLFISVRGTAFLYDWRLNFRASPVAVDMGIIEDHWFIPYNRAHIVRFHGGFAYEAMRLFPLIIKTLNSLDYQNKEIYICGHSLGGAVAAILQELLRFNSHPAYIFGAPRYADLTAYFHREQLPPVQTRRPVDIVPILPPRFMGYVDHPCELSTDGTEYFDPEPYSQLFGDWLRWGKFLYDGFEPHDIENYRKEIGLSAGLVDVDLPLIPFEQIKKNDLNPKQKN